MDYEVEFGYTNITLLLLTFIYTVADANTTLGVVVSVLIVVHFLYYQYDYEPLARKSRPRKYLEITLFANLIMLALVITTLFLKAEYLDVVFYYIYLVMGVSFISSNKYLILITYGRKRNRTGLR